MTVRSRNSLSDREVRTLPIKAQQQRKHIKCSQRKKRTLEYFADMEKRK